MTEDTFDPRTTAQRGAFAAVGAGVLAFQRFQVLRREVEREIERLEPEDISIHDPDSLDGQIDQLEAKLDVTIGVVKKRLPTAAEMVVNQAWEATKDTSAQVRSLLGRPPGRMA